MKNPHDARHKKRQGIVEDLFRKSFHDQPINPKASDIFSHLNFIDKNIQKAAPEFSIEKINKILLKAMSKKSRIASFCVLLKNSIELIKSPLTILLKDRLVIFKKTTLSPNKLLEVSFYYVCNAKKTFLKT